MQYDWLESYCLGKAGAVKEWKAEWECFRYMVGGKMFLMDGSDNNQRPILTLKLEPLHGELARREYGADVEPGYYMNKEHWNSISRTGAVPDDMLRSYIDESYRLIFGTLTKKLQKELEGRS